MLTCNEAGFREDGDAGNDGCVAFYGFIVEG